MKTPEQQLSDEIEVERLWVTTEQGEYVVFTMLPISIILMFGLWGTVSNALLVLWFFLLTICNLFRWKVLRYYNTHKASLVAGTTKFKRLMLLGSALTGGCWVLGITWFLVPSEATNILVISITLVIQIEGAIATWYSYLPAVIAITFPPLILLIALLFLQHNNIYIAAGLIFSLMAVLIIITSIKLAKMLNYALRLNYENQTLRKESEEKSILLETALENMSQGISMSDKNDRLHMWNRQFVKMLGDAGALVSSNADLAEILTAADSTDPTRLKIADRVFANQFEPDSSQRSLCAKTWKNYHLKTDQIYEIRQSELSQGGRVLTYTDITEQVKREQALEKARKEAEQANAAKTRFLAAASHDLRQPIHALGLFFAELSDQVLSPQTATLIGQIEDSIAAINSMLNALLDISKLDAGVIKPTIEPLVLEELFERLQTEFQPIALESHNKLRFRPTDAVVNTDPAMLERMLRNLIGNALRYTDNGRVLVAARPRGASLVCQVWDNGSGIPKDQLNDVFIEFHQLQNPARDRRRGLGLGLAIVKRLAKLLQHEIKVTSQFGRGSCFSITLPMTARSAARQLPQPFDSVASTNYALSGRHILILDDDISVLEGMQGLLQHWGCLVTTANSPAEAVDKLASGALRPELLIIDYRLTDNVSGIDVARSLQKRLGYPIGVLIITGDTGPERLQEAEASDFPLLHKPVHPAKLRSTLQYLMSNQASPLLLDNEMGTQ
ncbi:NahK/ErcS family hybrid sensor histidine kinase/response regulator [Methylomonas sp. OY6]|uniref:histidine kinase n=1 Tax=Methylomonas defluvii TaxID=3045149 RepID=A0ABU4UBG3_9GAMM|nr:NahK/ErcS family hybrid sensor histidine kinase/response regulator [Methylomonas sp. OY6]MDX8126787.1 NahK/ErcS family hybrid sensor histidine kinase/response regulator [Methylomonas sp. OY6]